MTTDTDTEWSKLQKKSIFYFKYFNQDTQWVPKTQVPVLIEDMDRQWRFNACKWLERRARMFEMYYTFGEIHVYSERLPIAIGPDMEISGDAAWAMYGIDSSLMPSPGSMAADAFDAFQDARERDPVKWIKTTNLYKALREPVNEPDKHFVHAQRHNYSWSNS